MIPDAWQRPLWKLGQRVERGVKRVVRPVWLHSLRVQNQRSDAPVVASEGPVVSMTTHGARLADAFYALESIAAGDVLPRRLVLWLDENLLAQGLPESLRRLARRGLEIRGTRDLGPHTKYLPQVLSDPDPRDALVTADDDMLYPAHWLRELVAAGRTDPDIIHCFRARVIRMGAGGVLEPYATWPHCESMRPSHLNFFTGVAGALYPPAMQAALRERADAFTNKCPLADDVWLNCVALRSRVRARQIVPVAARFYELPGTRGQGLARGNVRGGGNDRQIAATYTAGDLALLRSQPLPA